MRDILDGLTAAWSKTDLPPEALREFAGSEWIAEARQGVRTMAMVLTACVAVAALAHHWVGLDASGLYAFALVGASGIGVCVAARRVNDVRELHALATALLVVAAIALMFVSQRAGEAGPLLLANAVVLFVVIPLVPWGLREATAVTVILWLLLCLAAAGVDVRPKPDMQMPLPVLMFLAAVASLAVVKGAASIRRRELTARHALEETRARLHRTSNVDPLTGAWNRRYLDSALSDLCERFGHTETGFHFALFAIDDFRQVNDTGGFAVGDRVLVCMAMALRDGVGERGHIIRMGGDEFCAMFVARDPEYLLTETVDAIHRCVATAKGPGPVRLSISCGHIEASLDTTVPMSVLYRRADHNRSNSRHSQAERDGPPLDEVGSFRESGSWRVLGT